MHHETCWYEYSKKLVHMCFVNSAASNVTFREPARILIHLDEPRVYFLAMSRACERLSQLPLLPPFSILPPSLNVLAIR